MPIKRSHRIRWQSFSKRFIIPAAIALAAVLLVVVFFLLRGLFTDEKAAEKTPDADTATTTTVSGAEDADGGGTIQASGFPVTEGWFLHNEKAYYGTQNGMLYVGDHKINDTAYTFHTDGSLLNGWIQIDNLRYHFANGVMSKGTTEIDGKTRYLNSNGSMFVGWYDTTNGYRMYYDIETGVAYTGWHEIDGKHYCFDAAGFMYRDTTADGVPVDENGAADEAAYQAYVARQATATTSTAAGSTGATATRGTTVKTTAAKAVDTAALEKKLDDILNKHGRTPRNIYDYVHDNYTYKHAAEGTIEENALYLIENGTGSCYHFASLTYMLFKRAGYDVRYVTGLGWQNHTYHCWVLANFDGGWYYVDSLYVRSAKLTADDLKRIGYEWDESAYPS